MKMVSRVLLVIASVCLTASTVFGASADVTLSGIVGGDIRAIYSTLQAESYSDESSLVWLNGESIAVNTYSLRSGVVRELAL